MTSENFDPEVVPFILKHCLARGVKIYPHEIKSVVKRHKLYNLPDEDLPKLSHNDLQKYINALYLTDQEDAGSWRNGFKMLQELGFKEVRRGVNCRVYTSVEYVGA